MVSSNQFFNGFFERIIGLRDKGIGFKKYSKSKIFYTFLFSYLFILCISLMAGSFIYGNVLKIVKNEIKESNLSLLEQCRDTIDERMAEVDRIIVQVSMNDKINHLLRVPNSFRGDEYYKLWEIKNQLLPYSVSNDFVKNMFIYFKNSNVIISPSWGSDKLDSFYEFAWEYDGKEYNEWYRMVKEENINKKVLPSNMIKLTNEGKPMLTYIRKLTYNNSRDDMGKIIIFIDDNQITKLMNRINLKSGGWFSVIDETGMVLVSAGDVPENIGTNTLTDRCFLMDKGYFEHSTKDNELFITYTTSSYNKWVYTAAVPKDIIMDKVANIKRVAIFTAFLYLAIGLVIAFILAYRNAKPVKNMISSIRNVFSEGFQSGRNEYEIIQSTIFQIISNNKQLAKVIETQKPLLKSAFTKQLLNGEFKNMDELNAFMANAEINLKEGKFLSVILQITGYGDIIDEDILEELNRVRAIISNVEVNNKVLSYDINEKTIVFIFRYSINSSDEFVKEASEKAINNLYNELLNNYNIKCVFAFGDICNMALEIYSSFNKASITLETFIESSNEDEHIIKWYEEIPEKIGTYYYPPEIELRISNLIKSGEVLELEKVLQFLHYENFFKRKLKKDEYNVFINEICTTYSRVANSLRINDIDSYTKASEKASLTKIRNRRDAYSNIKQKMIGLCKKLDEERKEKSGELSRRLLEYINNNYSDPDLSLQSMAQHFGLNDVYMSRFFKKHIGENFSTYLEKIRIQNATEMLKLQKHTVNDVSQLVGYNSAMSFRRAFKKVMGVNPSDYTMES